MSTDAAARERETPSGRGEPIIGQSPKRKVGNSVYVSVPGRVPVIKAKRAKKD
ncbi:MULTISPECIES: hypothetical protein [unclassified Amycolatopsis]|uniref:hypothetical protein n=1 Tax=unclassified Amycolatopsis TaxID=2618356 RepID=UPI001FF49540|nr:hypothetical protein [Amycolatopsis sp. FBCC-B4732]UOX92487.1 hypothetical protein MUY14_18375 [Amycolatopsis sp. FBCC-B4732]